MDGEYVSSERDVMLKKTSELQVKRVECIAAGPTENVKDDKTKRQFGKK